MVLKIVKLIWPIFRMMMMGILARANNNERSSSILPSSTITINPIPVWRSGWTLAMNIICCQSWTFSSVPYFSNVPTSSTIPNAIVAISVIGSTIGIAPLLSKIFINSVFEKSMSSNIVIWTDKSNSNSTTACTSCKKRTPVVINRALVIVRQGVRI